MKERKTVVIRIALAIALTLVVIGLVVWFVLGFSLGRFVGDHTEATATSQTSQTTIKEQNVDYFNQFLPFESEYSYEPSMEGANLFYDLMRYFSSEKVTDDVRIESYSVTGAAYEEGVLTVTFTVWPETINRDQMVAYWGKVADDGSVRDICWQVTIDTTSQGDTAITKVATGDASLITEDNNQITVDENSNQTIDYKTEVGKDQLKLTYDGWKNQVILPYALSDFFGGEYSGDKQSLIDQSYVLTPDQTGFIRTAYATDDSARETVYYTYTDDQGSSWHDVVLEKDAAAIRYRKVAFGDDGFGYIFLSGGRVMSLEGYLSYITTDGGKTWTEHQVVEGVSSLLTDACYLNETLGFMSLGGVTPSEPNLYVTTDGGNTWLQSSFTMPDDLKKVFVVAEAPYEEDGALKVKVNQGSLGDYKGGNVKGIFISEDQGLTWTFEKEEAEETSEAG
ncbi:hypothetical protein A5886_000739 [Enterococcus sp. 8G7_MSG3316]|uniref:Uncharacterized protein n=1 Tax=Candidatus Enterococcus testudinis TaxID=1834191 RepID=A0A242A3R4_9ENTE|nr:oxidoreductase [Enterococcus sp. 8G7_MSG3316]OTN75664.1 hypothetical protein A5886_000739 [Enterococcus sp. 8G7_MSG3316]